MQVVTVRPSRLQKSEREKPHSGKTKSQSPTKTPCSRCYQDAGGRCAGCAHTERLIQRSCLVRLFIQLLVHVAMRSPAIHNARCCTCFVISRAFSPPSSVQLSSRVLVHRLQACQVRSAYAHAVIGCQCVSVSTTAGPMRILESRSMSQRYALEWQSQRSERAKTRC